MNSSTKNIQKQFAVCTLEVDTKAPTDTDDMKKQFQVRRPQVDTKAPVVVSFENWFC